MNGSELLLPFVVADQRRRTDEAVLVRLAREATNDQGRARARSERHISLATRLRSQLRAAAFRGQLGPASPRAIG
jgi:hypothetical protein